MKRDDGGQAFPVHSAIGAGEGGMSLRDWFAGQALPEAFAEVVEANADGTASYNQIAAAAASGAYAIADAMLAERNK